MKLLFSNRWFWLSLVCIVVQQAFVGASTYAISVAGRALSAGTSEVFVAIVWFFGLILGAYLVGGYAQIVCQKVANQTWKRYYENLFSFVRRDFHYNTHRNKKLTNAWVTTEALTTLEDASSFVMDMTAVYCNVIFTAIVFFFALTPKIAGTLLGAICFSFFLVFISTRKLKRFADGMQNSKVLTTQSVSLLWDNLFFGDTVLADSSSKEAEQRAGRYFHFTEGYKVWEQVSSSLPIFLTVPILLYVVHEEMMADPLLLGALVATLPRTLQVFQNIHLATSHANRFVLIKNKLANLIAFPSQLEKVDFKKLIGWETLKVQSVQSQKVLVAENFAVDVLDGKIRQGRFLITGANGAGKSSLLKYLKSELSEALFVGVDVVLGRDEQVGSTGEKRMQLFSELTQRPVQVFLLDEWDANLDAANLGRIDSLLNSFSENRLVVEVRH